MIFDRVKNKPIFAFAIFLLIEYVLRNFVPPYKFQAGSFSELLPIVSAAIIVVFVARKEIIADSYWTIFRRLSLASIFGIIIAKTLTFVQWYWIAAPEYRQVEGDMELALGWLGYLSVLAALKIAVSFLVLIALVKGINNSRGV